MDPLATTRRHKTESTQAEAQLDLPDEDEVGPAFTGLPSSARLARTCMTCGNPDPRISASRGELQAHCCGQTWTVGGMVAAPVRAQRSGSVGKQVIEPQYSDSDILSAFRR